MRIVHIDIQNFRKLKSCRVEFATESTIFVGANNSGKTSAMDALIMFLKKSKRKNISTTDFTLSNWADINNIGEKWVAAAANNNVTPDLTQKLWQPFLPSIDVWIRVEDEQIHYVSHLLPTLDWNSGLLGVRLVFEPKNPEELYKGFIAAFTAAKNTTDSRNKESSSGSSVPLSLWPTSMRDFLDKEIHKYCAVNAYVLDPSKCEQTEPQALPTGSEILESEPFDGLFKIDIINAQRGFSDPNSADGISNSDRRLSSQLRHYFDKHLDPANLPEASDLDALEAMETARTVFDEKLKTSFSNAIGELEGLNYPGFSDPEILLSSKVNPLEGLNHDSAVQFRIVKGDDAANHTLCLPEKYNGLGYQNLISMIFSLIRFRDEWMRVGKAGNTGGDNSPHIEPLHLMLIEEPEAHLHTQVQQVFIKKAYSVLRNHQHLEDDNPQFATQMVVSTHSSHIAHETDFTSLRYFRRQPLANSNDVPCATVVNMTPTFGSDVDTARFATRYLRTTHCDLFFADAVILVEGPAERMLVPHFIRCKYPELNRSYISLLEIGGSHAHRLRPLIEALGLPTLVITDLDSIGANSRGKVLPEKGINYRTGNDTLKSWLPCKESLDEVLNTKHENKTAPDGKVRVAYPSIVLIEYIDNSLEEAIPYTFEDALALSNLDLFKRLTGEKGLVKKIVEAVGKPTLQDACQAMFDALGEGSKKAEMALDLLYTADPNDLCPPEYIAEGLEWLKCKLTGGSVESMGSEMTEEPES
jgi:predicted ATP-dependent endonuclease of OLD family